MAVEVWHPRNAPSATCTCNFTLMRSIAIPLILACLAPTAAPAQDLGLVEGLFQEVTAVTVFYQRGWVPSSD